MRPHRANQLRPKRLQLHRMIGFAAGQRLRPAERVWYRSEGLELLLPLFEPRPVGQPRRRARLLPALDPLEEVLERLRGRD